MLVDEIIQREKNAFIRDIEWTQSIMRKLSVCSCDLRAGLFKRISQRHCVRGSLTIALTC